jgi:hypothetical protein
VAAGLWAQQNDLIAYRRDHKLRMPVALDQTGAFFRAYQVADVPAFVVLDRKGKVIARTNRADEANWIATKAQSNTAANKEP